MITLTLWIPAAIAAVKGVANIGLQGYQNAKNRRFAEKQSEIAWTRQLDLRKWDNEYNTPQSQMQRLKQAGINPLLPFLGKGSASGGTSATPSSPQMAKFAGTAPQMENVHMDIYDMALKKAGTDKIIEETSGLKTANERALITWLQDKGFIEQTQAAAAAQKIAESGLKDLEFQAQHGRDKYNQLQGTLTEQQLKDNKIHRGQTNAEQAGYQREKVNQTTIKKANQLIEANTANVHANNMARKALKEWLDNPKGGWEALKTTLLLILGK